MSIFTKKPVFVATTVNHAIGQMQKQADELFDMEERLHDEIDTQRDIIKAAQDRVAVNQAEIAKSEAIRKALSSAIQTNA